MGHISKFSLVEPMRVRHFLKKKIKIEQDNKAAWNGIISKI